MRVNLSKPLFAKLKFVRANNENCCFCVFYNRIKKACRAVEISCSGGHWEVDKVLPQSEVTFDLLQLQDSINSVDTKMKQFKSEVQQIKEEVKEEPKYFY